MTERGLDGWKVGLPPMDEMLATLRARVERVLADPKAEEWRKERCRLILRDAEEHVARCRR